LHLGNSDGPTSDRLNRSQRYDPIIGIMRHPSIQSFKIRGPRNFSKRSSLLSHGDEFPNLRHLDVSLTEWGYDIPGVNCLVSKSIHLSSIALGPDGYGMRDLERTFDDLILPPALRRLDISLHQWEGYNTSTRYIISKALDVPGLTVGAGLKGKDIRFFLEAYNAIAEHRTNPLVPKDWNFCIPPPPKESKQAMTTEKYVKRLLDFYEHWKRNDLKLDVDDLDELAADAIITNGSRFTKIFLGRRGQLGDSFVDSISCIVGRSVLWTITIWMREDEGRVRILESIQWKHLRVLDITLNPGTFETSVMRVLVDGVTKMSEKVELERFLFWSETDTPLTLPEGDLLQAFVASMALRDLQLEAAIPLERILSLCRSTDVSELGTFKLSTDGIDSVKVDAILDSLQHATNLRHLHLAKANITKEQYDRMKAKGITLKNTWYL
ncbi:hypothetical protein BGX34_005005, partial [Mortierella sp. NVP85]